MIKILVAIPPMCDDNNSNYDTSPQVGKISIIITRSLKRKKINVTSFDEKSPDFSPKFYDFSPKFSDFSPEFPDFFTEKNSVSKIDKRNNHFLNQKNGD